MVVSHELELERTQVGEPLPPVQTHEQEKGRDGAFYPKVYITENATSTLVVEGVASPHHVEECGPVAKPKNDKQNVPIEPL